MRMLLGKKNWVKCDSYRSFLFRSSFHEVQRAMRASSLRTYLQQLTQGTEEGR
jgi:hypothetical protein